MIINLFGAPCAGKSTFAAGLFNYMKRQHMSVEYADEYAKRKVYEENVSALKCQPYIFGNQLYKLFILDDKVDYTVNDSPLLLSSIYNEDYPKSFDLCVKEVFDNFSNCNILCKQNLDNYQDDGRVHSKQQSIEVQNKIIDMLTDYQIPYLTIDPYDNNFETVANYAREQQAAI